jgi:hypothetical protein
MLLLESRFINKAKGFAAAKTTAKTRAKTVERRILLVLREYQWMVWWCRGGEESVEKDLTKEWRWSRKLRVAWNFTSTLGTDARERFQPIAQQRHFCVTLRLGSDCSCLLRMSK